MKFLKFNKFKELNESYIFEGGNIFKGKTDKIPREYIDPTLDKYYEHLGELFPKKKNVFTQFKPVGSVGKKPMSGDIDLAIDVSAFFPKKEVDPKALKDWNVDVKKWEKSYETMKKRARSATDSSIRWRAFLKELGEYINSKSDDLYIEVKKTSAGNMFGLFPQYNDKGERQDIGVQMDWMVGNLDWLMFSYYSDAPVQNVKGLHRTQLMLSMFQAKDYSFDHVNGVKSKETGEIVANKSAEATDLLGKLYGDKLTQTTLQNYPNLHEYLKKNTDKKEYQKVLDIYFRILDRTRADIPWDMQEDWIKSQKRLGLSGKFLPPESKLTKYKK
tara:strand:+ start:6203 stop:7192 length:990 start_codon:yes stop_codon:yes gene_type:complete